MVDTPDSLRGSKDGPGWGDRDQQYTWGCPKVRLSAHDLARLLLLRSHVIEAREGYTDAASDDLEPALWTQGLP